MKIIYQSLRKTSEYIEMIADPGVELDEWVSINLIFMLLCTCLMFLIVLGIALYYSGLTQRRSSLSMLAIPLIIFPIIMIEWYIWSYSLCYSSASNHFIGDLDFSVLRHLRVKDSLIYSTPRGNILSVIHFLFNGLMKLVCASLTFPGCVAERGRLLPMFIFLIVWSCIIYNPVTYWFWNREGWLSTELGRLPVLDFAGGNCIHIVSGFTALAYSYILGPRNPKILLSYRSSSTGNIVIGTFLILFGWCGFLVGCDYKFSTESLYITINIMICSSISAITWTLIDYYYSVVPYSSNSAEAAPIISHGTEKSASSPAEESVRLDRKKVPGSEMRKISMVSFSSGVITGLVVVTPGGGYISSSVDFWKAFVFGVVGAVVTNLSTRLKYILHIDDALDIFAIHGIAGITGSLLTGIFANKNFGSEGGWIEGHWIQLGYQLLGCVVVAVYVFVLSAVFLYLIDLIPWCHLRIDKTFNKRERQRKRSRKLSTNTKVEEGAKQLSENEVYDDMEKLELLGADNYYFNLEFSMDFMEFIKVIRPEDYSEDITGDAMGDSIEAWAISNDLEIRENKLEGVYRPHTATS